MFAINIRNFIEIVIGFELDFVVDFGVDLGLQNRPQIGLKSIKNR